MPQNPIVKLGPSTYSNVPDDENQLPEGLTPVTDTDTDNSDLPDGLTRVWDTVDLHRKPQTAYTGSPHRQPVQAPKDTSLGEDIWTELNRPHLDLTPSDKTLDKIDPRSLNESPTMARIRGFGAGALKGLGDLASGLTSDLGLATLPTYLEGGVLGEDAAAAAKLLSPAAKAAGAAFATTGAKNLINPNSTWEQRLEAIPQIAGGVAPFLHGHPVASPLEQLGEAAANDNDNPPPSPPTSPVAKQGNFFQTDTEGNIDVQPPAPKRPVNPPAKALESEFEKPIKWNGVSPIVSPAAEFHQPSIFDERTPFTSSAVQQQLAPEPEVPRNKQGQLNLELARPSFDRYTESELFPSGRGGGLNEDMTSPNGEEPIITNKNTAKQIVNSLPDDKEGNKVSPFPMADNQVLDELIRNKQVDYQNPRLEDVPLHNLIGTQESVNPDKVNEYIDKGERPRLDEVPTQAKGRMDSDAPVVIRVGDENILAGGHHRATADLVNGKDDMQAVVYDAKVPQDLLDRFRASLERDKAGRQYAAPNAKFAFHQDDFNGGTIPMYNVEGGPLDKSTVSADTLREHGIAVPETPSPESIQDNPNLHPQEMTATDNPNNIAVGGAPPRLVKMLGQNLYSKDRATIATKELIQNAVDEHKIAGVNAPVKVLFSHEDTNPATGQKSKSITIGDNGRGMTPQQLRTVFTNVGESGKTEEQIASGGFGLAKAAPMMGGKFSHFESVINEDGKKVKYTFEGTPDQLQNQANGVPLTREEVPDDTPTGFRAKVYFDTIGNAARQAEGMAKNSYDLGSPIHIATNYGKNEPNDANEFFNSNKGYLNRHMTEKYEPNTPSELQDTIHTPGADINIHYRTPTTRDKAQTYDLHILNKGLHQYSDTRNPYSPFGALRGVPAEITANVIPKVEEDVEGYPFTMNREQLDDKVAQGIHDWVTKNIISGALEKQKSALQDMYKGMTPIPHAGATFKPTVLFDPEDLLTPVEKQDMLQNPALQKMSAIFDGFLSRSVAATGQTGWSDRLQKTGITLDPTVHGIHIPNPDKANSSTILINPFNFLHSAETPIDAAREIVATMLHEAGHVGDFNNTEGMTKVDWSKINTNDPSIGDFFKHYFNDVQHGTNVSDSGHGLNWLRNLAEVYSKTGNEAYGKAVGELENVITEPNTSKYSPDIQKLLQIYSDRQGRTGTEKDILSRTGIESKVTGTPQDDISHDAESSRIGPSGADLTQEFNRPISRFKTTNATSTAAQSQTHPAESATTEVVNNIKKTIPQSQIPNRISNISDHLEAAKNDPGVTKDEKEGLIEKALNFQRTLLTSFDLSAPGRQGLPLIWNKAWWTSWKPMLKSFGSDGAFNNVMRSIKEDPSGFFKPDDEGKSFANRVGLDLTDTLSHREEIFRSQWAENYVPGVKPSVRAYTAYMNKLRADTFKSMVKTAGAENNIPAAKAIADFINVATGRGSLGAFERASKPLAQIFFSPRLTASRFQMYSRTLNPKFYMNVPPVVRQAQLKSAFATAGLGILLGQLAKGVGAEVNSDPTNTDFGKIKFGDTRIDPFAGHQQYLVAAARILMGQSTSSTTGRTTDLTSGKFGMPTRADIVSRFMEQKLAPVPSMVWSWMQGKDFDGTPFSVKKELANRTIPLAMQDIYQVWQHNPDTIPYWLAQQIGDNSPGQPSATLPGLLASGASIGGFGVQTYGR